MAHPTRSPSPLQVIEKAQTEGSIASHHVALCDAHDLIALLGTGNASESAATVYRLKGEVAFTVPLRDDEDLRPLSLQWKPDGSLLALTWTDQVCCLYSGENGKLLYELPTKPFDGGAEAGWPLDINANPARSDAMDATELAADETVVSAPTIWTSYGDSWIAGGKCRPPADEHLETDESIDIMTDGLLNRKQESPRKSDSGISKIVNSLTTLDSTTVLPRLSRIETSTGMRYSPDGNKFSTQASADIIFDASSFAPGVFSTLLASDAHGRLTVFVDETIKVGHVQLPSAEQVKSASCSASIAQVMISRDAERRHLYQLNFIDLPLDRLGSSLNYIISLNTRRLQSLAAYITHTVRSVHQEIQTGIKGVPTRLLKLLEEDLRTAASGQAPPASNSTSNLATLELQHLALTSNFDPVVLEWLKDIVKETGHKRWDQATSAMYEHIQSYLFKNLLPALQRCIAAVSALRGQARFHQHTGRFAIRFDVLDVLIEWADTLSLVAQRTLQAVTEEHIQFKAFSKWLRVMIDVAVAGPGTKGADETEEREAPNYDMDLCLRYINGPLMESSLKVLAESTPFPSSAGIESREEFFKHPIVQAMSRENTVAALENLHAGSTRLEQRSKDDNNPHPSDPINLPLLTCLLKAHTRLAIDEVNAWQAHAVPQTPETVVLDGLTGEERIWDMCVSAPTSASSEGVKEIVHILADASHSSASSNETRGLQLITVSRLQATTTPPRIHTQPILPLAPSETKSSKSSSSSSSSSSPPAEPPPEVLHAAFLPYSERPNSTQPHPHKGPPPILLLTKTAPTISQSEPEPSHTLLLLHLHNHNQPNTRGGKQTPTTTTLSHQTLHTFSPSSSTTPAPQYFRLSSRPGKRIVVVFFPSPGSGSGSGSGSGRAVTRWEVLDLEDVLAAGPGEDEDEDGKQRGEMARGRGAVVASTADDDDEEEEGMEVE